MVILSRTGKSKEKFSKYHAFCAALAKKIYGNNSRVNAIVESGKDRPHPTKKKKIKVICKKESTNV